MIRNYSQAMDFAEPGTLVVRGVPFSVYCEIDAVNQSTLQAFGRSMRHGDWAAKNPKPETPPMVLGRAVHTLLLDGEDVFRATYATGGPINERTGNAYGRETKAFREWLEIQGEHMEYLSEKEIDYVYAMRDALDRHPQAGALIRESGAMHEITVVWDEPWGDGSVRCKCRIDYIHPQMGVLDLKTTRDCRIIQFARSIFDHRYYWQAAWYTRASVRAGLNKHEDFGWIAVENEPPHDVALWSPSDQMLTQGTAEVLQALACYTRWVDAGKVPEPAEGNFRQIDLPAWGQDNSVMLPREAEGSDE